MGWNSWNKFGCDVGEALVKSAADAMVASGMKDAGYQYVVIDDCWQVSRDGAGRIVADPQRFPSGIKALADTLHAKGLKLGIYSDAGTLTCAKRPGSKDHEAQDAARGKPLWWRLQQLVNPVSDAVGLMTNRRNVSIKMLSPGAKYAEAVYALRHRPREIL